jgi:hypothetical protein
MPHAVSPFLLASFKPPLPGAEDEGVVDGLVQISQTFTGDLAAHSRMELPAVRAGNGVGTTVANRMLSVFPASGRTMSTGRDRVPRPVKGAEVDISGDNMDRRR